MRPASGVLPGAMGTHGGPSAQPSLWLSPPAPAGPAASLGRPGGPCSSPGTTGTHGRPGTPGLRKHGRFLRSLLRIRSRWSTPTPVSLPPARLPLSVCPSLSPSVHPPELSTPTGWLPLPGGSRAGLPDPPALGVPCHRSPVPWEGRALGTPPAAGDVLPAGCSLGTSQGLVSTGTGGAGALLPPGTRRTMVQTQQAASQQGLWPGRRGKDGEGATTAASTRGGAGEPSPGLEPSPGTEPRGGEARAPLTSA